MTQPDQPPRGEVVKTARPFGAKLLVSLQAAQTVVVNLSITLAPESFWVPVRLDWSREVLAVIITGIGVTIALGLALGRRWAWGLAALWMAVSLALALVAYLSGTPLYPLMVVSVLTVFYLNQRDVQIAYGVGTRTRERAE